MDVKTYLVDDILTKVDRMSMAVSLEAREPLLDHKLLEFAATVPTSLKLKDGRSKYLLRRLLERRVPQASSIVPSTGSKRRSASGSADRWRRWSTRCCSTAGCATRHLRRSRWRVSGTSIASGTPIIATGCGAS